MTSLASPGWTYNTGSPVQQANMSHSFNQSGAGVNAFINISNRSAQSFESPYKQKFNENEFIMDKKGLADYLK
jgi:hypothetical protein